MNPKEFKLFRVFLEIMEKIFSYSYIFLQKKNC